jgi:head-tail adaptor
MSGARGRMRHRATVERATATPDGGGGETLGWNTHIASLPCWTWFDARREGALEETQGDKVTVLEDRRMIVPLGTDITEKDRIAVVKDRRGATLFAGPMRIESVGRRDDHMELYLSEVT